MEPILVDRKKLIEIIEGNRARHVKTYDKAMGVWRDKMAAALWLFTNKVRSVRAKWMNAKIGTAFVMPTFEHLPQPQKFTDQYDQTLGMLRMSVESTVKLDTEDYQRFVKDKWEWAHLWAASTQNYAGAKAVAKLKERR